MKITKISELKEGREYIATDKDGNKHPAQYVNDYAPGGIVFCVYPAFTANGEKNNLIYFEEANSENN